MKTFPIPPWFKTVSEIVSAFLWGCLILLLMLLIYFSLNKVFPEPHVKIEHHHHKHQTL